MTISTAANQPSQLQSEIVEESEHTFGGLPAGTAIRVTVQARNHRGGESSLSAPGNGTVP